MNIPSEFHLAASLFDRGAGALFIDQAREAFRGKGTGAEARAALYDVLSDWRAKEEAALKSLAQHRDARRAHEDVLRESHPF